MCQPYIESATALSDLSACKFGVCNPFYSGIFQLFDIIQTSSPLQSFFQAFTTLLHHFVKLK